MARRTRRQIAGSRLLPVDPRRPQHQRPTVPACVAVDATDAAQDPATCCQLHDRPARPVVPRFGNVRGVGRSSLRPPRPSDPGDRGLRRALLVLCGGAGVTFLVAAVLGAASQSWDVGTTEPRNPTGAHVATWLAQSLIAWFAVIAAVFVIVLTRARKAQRDPVRNPPRWTLDPTGRHEHRYWDGLEWTETIADRGVVGVDPLGPGH